MHLTSIITLGVSLLTGFVWTATIADVAASNYALAQQCIDTDEAVVAITADTPATVAQDVPTALQSMTNAIASAHAAMTPTAPTSDNVTEFMLARSWGLFANEVEELMGDYVEQKPNLVDVFDLKSAILEQCLAFDTSFQDYAAFMLTLVEPDGHYYHEILYNTANATGVTNTGNTGINETIYEYEN